MWLRKIPQVKWHKVEKMETEGTYTMAPSHEELQHRQKTTTKHTWRHTVEKEKSKVGDCSLGLAEEQQTERNRSTLQRLNVKPSHKNDM